MIYTEKRKFETAQKLIDSASLSKFGQQLTGKTKCYWWVDEPVTFSSKFVEVIGKEVTVRWPAYYRTFRFGSYSEALLWAEEVNSEWEKADQINWRDFVNQVSKQIP